MRYYGPIHEDGHVAKRGQVMSQFVRFIRPGYFRLFATQRPQSQFYITAYKGDGKVVLVAINQRARAVDQTLIFKRGQVRGFTPYVTSQSENGVRREEVAGSNGKCTVTLAPSSVTTLVSQ